MAASPERSAGLFGPQTLTWRVNRELVLLAGGGRALLLQVAHPLVAAAVEQHSDYTTDPWGRLYRTLDVTTRIVFGDLDASREAATRLERVHERVAGVSADGTPYRAADPDLLLWVWATLVDTSLMVYTRYVAQLSGAQRERYYQEQTRFARACGVPEGHWPADHGAFAGYLSEMIAGRLRVTEAARRVAGAVLRPPLAQPLRGALGLPLGLLTVGLLPPAVREAYGFPWGPGRQRLLDASGASMRRLLPLLPGPAREFPAARRARARVRG